MGRSRWRARRRRTAGRSRRRRRPRATSPARRAWRRCRATRIAMAIVYLIMRDAPLRFGRGRQRGDRLLLHGGRRGSRGTPLPQAYVRPGPTDARIHEPLCWDGPNGDPCSMHRGNGVHHDDEPHRSRDRRQPGHRVRDRRRVRRPGPPRGRHRPVGRGPRGLAHGARGCHGCRVRRRGVHRGRGGPRPGRGRRGERRHHARHAAHAHERGRLHERDRHQPHGRVPRREARLEGHAQGAVRPHRAHLERRRALRRPPARSTTRRRRPASSAWLARSRASSARGTSPRTSSRPASSRPT